jgi:hypothetical protein
MTHLGFSQLIERIESEIRKDYLPGAIKWCDRMFNEGWSKAIDRFDQALSVANERKDYMLAKMEGDFYLATILDLLSKYKRHKDLDDTQEFLRGIVPV